MEVRTNTGLKLSALKVIAFALISWLLFSILNEIGNGIYMSLSMLAGFAFLQVDKILVSKNSVTLQRFYIYSLIRIEWRIGPDQDASFSLYSKIENESLPASLDPTVDLIKSLIPFRVKVQGVLVRKGSAWFARRVANFSLNDKEFATVSGCISK